MTPDAINQPDFCQEVGKCGAVAITPCQCSRCMVVRITLKTIEANETTVYKRLAMSGQAIPWPVRLVERAGEWEEDQNNPGSECCQFTCIGKCIIHVGYQDPLVPRISNPAKEQEAARLRITDQVEIWMISLELNGRWLLHRHCTFGSHDNTSGSCCFGTFFVDLAVPSRTFNIRDAQFTRRKHPCRRNQPCWILKALTIPIAGKVFDKSGGISRLNLGVKSG